jgi:hypothetical protein
VQIAGQPLPGMAPLVLPVMRRLGLRDRVDGLVPKVWDNGVTRGQAVEVLLGCILQLDSPLALSRVKATVSELGLDVVLGVEADQLHDDKLGETLDALVPVKAEGELDLQCVQRLEQGCADAAIEWLGLAPQAVLFDFTRLRLSGTYRDSQLARHGRRSGGHKQLQSGLNVLAGVGLPVASQVHPGNANQTVNVPANLAALQERLPGRKLTVITDSAGLSHANLLAYERAGMGFISPNQLTPAEEARMRSYATAELVPLDYQPESGGRFWGLETTWELTRQKHAEPLTLRVLIIRSSSLRRQEQQQLLRRVRQLRQRLQAIRGYLNHNRYFHADYARAQLEQALATSDAGRFVRYELRGASGALTLEWVIDAAALRDHLRRLGRSVLFTNQSPEEYSAAELLQTYKSQHQVEANFRQLKDELQVAPVFLKNENRIVALAALYVLALMVLAVLQFLARQAGLQTPRGRAMTARELLLSYGGWSGVILTTPRERYIQPNPATERQRAYLAALAFPPPEHWIPQRHRLPEHVRIPGM